MQMVGIALKLDIEVRPPMQLTFLCLLFECSLIFNSGGFNPFFCTVLEPKHHRFPAILLDSNSSSFISLFFLFFFYITIKSTSTIGPMIVLLCRRTTFFYFRHPHRVQYSRLNLLAPLIIYICTNNAVFPRIYTYTIHIHTYT